VSPSPFSSHLIHPPPQWRPGSHWLWVGKEAPIQDQGSEDKIIQVPDPSPLSQTGTPAVGYS
jgi:hypothetical protein